MRFESYEIGLVGKYQGNTGSPDDTYIERIFEGEPEDDDSFVESFWTLYGRFSDGRAIAVFNSNCFQGCLDIYSHITGHHPNLPTPDCDNSYEATGLWP
jgi:hypothetical protein